MSAPYAKGRHAATFFPREGGPVCWSCGDRMPEVAPGTDGYDTWRCPKPECDVTERVRSKV